jgi:hypothetical protein
MLMLCGVLVFKGREDAIVSETYLIQDNRLRRTLEESKKERRDKILSEYHSYNFPNGIKPTLNTFLSIPIIRTLQKSITAPVGVDMQTGKTMGQGTLARGLYYYTNEQQTWKEDPVKVSETLRDARVKPLLLSGIAQWRNGAIEGARELLGYAKPTTRIETQRENKTKAKAKAKGEGKGKGKEKADAQEATTTEGVAEPSSAANDPSAHVELKPWRSDPHKVDPELRITSWFVCTKCREVDSAYKRLRVLDFKGLCTHQCVQPGKKKKDVTSWHICKRLILCLTCLSYFDAIICCIFLFSKLCTCA